MRVSSCIGVLALVATAGTTFGAVADIDSAITAARIYNDFPGTTLNITNNYPSTVEFQESDFPGGSFANKHAAWFSADGGATKYDFNYADSFYMSTDMVVTDATGVGNVEAGLNADLFGFGQLGVLTANGEIAAFGSTLPYHSFGTGLYSVGDTVTLTMIYRAGSAEFVDPSTIEYRYSVNAGPTVSSGQIAFTNTEMGIPSAFTQYLGVGVQFDNPAAGASADVIFSNLVVVPNTGAFALFGCAGLAGLRRRR